MSRCARSLLLAALVVLWCAAAAPAAAPPPADDGPGALSHFDLARKDCVGTARNTTSKVWFTVAGGVLSDVYYPTNDNTNNETLQYVVTDGSTFTDLQTRDMTYTVKATDDRALTCRVTATAKSGRYRIVTDYLTDPIAPDGPHALAVRGAEGRAADYRSTSATTRRSTATAAAAAARPTATAAPTPGWPTPAATRCSSAPTR